RNRSHRRTDPPPAIALIRELAFPLCAAVQSADTLARILRKRAPKAWCDAPVNHREQSLGESYGYIQEINVRGGALPDGDIRQRPCAGRRLKGNAVGGKRGSARHNIG